MPVIARENTRAGAVRVRARATDPLEGLRGHAYIAARQLNNQVQRLDAGIDHHTERVNNILEQWKPLATVIPIQLNRQARKAGRR